MSQTDYLNAAHIVPQPYSNAHRGVIDSYLASRRLTRNAIITLPFFSMAPYLLVNSDLVFTTSRHFANYYENFLPLKTVEAPIAFPEMRFYQLWHERTHRSARMNGCAASLPEPAPTTGMPIARKRMACASANCRQLEKRAAEFNLSAIPASTGACL